MEARIQVGDRVRLEGDWTYRGVVVDVNEYETYVLIRWDGKTKTEWVCWDDLTVLG